MRKNNLIVFATYWNEIDWIESSLKQIELLNPKEIIICDGCFDSTRLNYSTDGTREFILKWAKNKTNVEVISAIRVSRFEAFFRLMFGHKKIVWYRFFTTGRIKALYFGLTMNKYRLNQALTFQKMINLSKFWKPGFWTTTIDCDQFFSDKMLEEIPKIVNNCTEYGIIVGKENTFFENFKFYTNDYEKRNYNNLPHKIYSSTTFIPTRGIILEDWRFSNFNFKNFFKSEFYINKVKAKNLGYYNHYKFKFDKKRFKEGYLLGDRKEPKIEGFKFELFKRKHPLAVKNLVSRKLK